MNNRLRAVLSQLKLKWTAHKERRQMMALAAAGGFLLFSFWNSFQNNRLKSDLRNARVEETIQAGRVHAPQTDADFAAVVLVEIDEQGQFKNLVGDPGSVSEKDGVFGKLSLTPMKINNVARAARVPLTIPLDSGAKGESQEPNTGTVASRKQE